MKLLFDQNISFRIVTLLKSQDITAAQVRELGLENATDVEIWDYAKKHGYTVVTFDGDFLDIGIIKGFPPKIIWLRVGNTSTKNLARIILTKIDSISEFIENKSFSQSGCLEIRDFE